ncbi:hypothetical protein BUALT_Bualt06G0109700 [Buddleja alternifolia]|uniref:DNA-directed RNA polymerase III subunit RPC3 n=1 Tax=Buddleja alternifolia TaxID=168488 RepID=A0AAV6XL89_9LAMI|nr:hypothetical protein BUALT_Bualt06G0109700 [Buddleja alternifolia]
MVSPHGIQLAAHIISSFYGDLCSKVCDCLLRRGTLTLAQIIRFTELTRENVINCLRVLIHQNCVQAFAIQQEGAFGEAPRIVTQYMALFDSMIHKLRAPKFMQIVSDELGKDCLGIFQGLLQHGRLSINQIIDRHEQTAGGASDVHVARESFNRLLCARFVERCPAPEPFLAPPAEEETPAKKRGAKSKIAEERQTTEQRALAAAAPMESMRFLMDMDDLSVEKGEESRNNAKSAALGEKRKQDVLKSDENILDPNKKKEVLWRVNFEELVHHMRHKACISYVETRRSKEAGIVLSAMLELNGRSETRQKAEKSAYLSINAIYDEVIKKEGGLGMDFERISVSLEQLECQTLSVGLDETYSIDIKRIIEMAQSEEVESVIWTRYGKEAYRIFRLLSKAGRLLESDKISDTTFVEKKDAIKILYRLWKDDYLHMEKVFASGAKQSLFLLWRVNKQPLVEQVLDEMYHAALNLRLRIAHEQDQGKEVRQLPREKLVGDLEKRYKRLGKVRVILESSLMNLDDAIMLFHDF